MNHVRSHCGQTICWADCVRSPHRISPHVQGRSNGCNSSEPNRPPVIVAWALVSQSGIRDVRHEEGAVPDQRFIICRNDGAINSLHVGSLSGDRDPLAISQRNHETTAVASAADERADCSCRNDPAPVSSCSLCAAEDRILPDVVLWRRYHGTPCVAERPRSSRAIGSACPNPRPRTPRPR